MKTAEQLSEEIVGEILLEEKLVKAAVIFLVVFAQASTPYGSGPTIRLRQLQALWSHWL